jgi:hypothetical protein
MRSTKLASLPIAAAAGIAISLMTPIASAHAATPATLGGASTVDAPSGPSDTPTYGMVATAKELEFCSKPANSLGCVVAFADASEAVVESERLYPDSLHNGVGDAFRHCYWTATMTVHLGLTAATGFAARHEVDPTQPLIERQMDLRNDWIGGSVGTTVKTMAEAEAACVKRVQGGWIWTIVDGQLVPRA